MSGFPRVLMLALDAASPTLLRQWIADGTLPHLRSLADSALALTVEGPEGMEVGATWPTFFTGTGPGEHGVCWLDRVIPGTYREQRMDTRDLVHLRPFWVDLCEAGRRVAILDVPFAPLRDDLRGIQICEWGAHEGLLGFQTRPRSLKRQIHRTWGEYAAPLLCETGRRTPREYRALADTMITGITTRGAMTTALLERGDWEFAIQVFTELHCANHLLWHFHDRSHPNAEAQAIADVGDLLRDVYRAADAALGAIIERVPSDTMVLTGSLHGMSHTCGASLLLPQMLEGTGAFRRASAVARNPEARGGATSHGIRSRLRSAYHLVPESVRTPMYEWRQTRINRQLLRRGEPLDLEPTATHAFQTGFGAGSTFSGIRLNIRGREPAGTLAVGQEVDRFVDQLERDLRAFVDPETHQPLVRSLQRTSDWYPGQRTGELPDLLVEWQHDPARGSTIIGNGQDGVWRGWSERTGLIEHANGSGRSGSHRLQGLIFVRGGGNGSGGGIGQGALARVVPTVDLAPTISAMLGVEWSRGPGTPLRELVGHA